MLIEGTIVNIDTVIGGSVIGYLLGNRLSTRVRAILMAGLVWTCGLA